LIIQSASRVLSRNSVGLDLRLIVTSIGFDDSGAGNAQLGSDAPAVVQLSQDIGRIVTMPGRLFESRRSAAGIKIDEIYSLPWPALDILEDNQQAEAENATECYSCSSEAESNHMKRR